MDKKTKDIQWQQYRNLLVIVGILFAVILLVMMVIGHRSQSQRGHQKTIRFTSPMKNDAIDRAWLEDFQTTVDAQKKQTTALKSQIDYLLKDKLAQKKESDQQKSKQYQAVLQKLASVEKALHTAQAAKLKPTAATFPTANKSIGQNTFPTIPSEPVPMNETSQLHQNMNFAAIAKDGDDHLSLTPHRKRQPTYLQNIHNYVPSGTHVLGVLLMGADMVANSDNQNNPKPVLIRLITNGTLPNHHTTHLKGCVITAAMRGDISSSRGDVRLERLSCVTKHHGIIDVSVNGTVATHAKEGIAGQLYSREGSRVTTTTLAGTLAGVADGISQGYVNTQNTIFGSSGTINKGQLAQYGAMQGASSGLNKLSDYEMSRADQIHPIIEVNGGKYVTVVFTHGFYLHAKKSVAQQADNTSQTAINDSIDTLKGAS